MRAFSLSWRRIILVTLWNIWIRNNSITITVCEHFSSQNIYSNPLLMINTVVQRLGVLLLPQCHQNNSPSRQWKRPHLNGEVNRGAEPWLGELLRSRLYTRHAFQSPPTKGPIITCLTAKWRTLACSAFSSTRTHLRLDSLTKLLPFCSWKKGCRYMAARCPDSSGFPFSGPTKDMMIEFNNIRSPLELRKV
jgi:hypothetical protein